MMKRKEFKVTLLHKEYFVLVQMHVQIDLFGICSCVNDCRLHGIDWQTKLSWIFTCIRTHVRTHTCMHILSIKVNEKRWWIHARYFLSLQMLTSILFAAVGVVGAGYSVIVSSVAINHGPLCLVAGEVWETPFSNG